MMTRIYKWLCLFFYRKWVYNNGVKTNPVGVPGQRDPDNTCELYTPIKKHQVYKSTCQSDGHYLCEKCIFLDKEESPFANYK